ncbi:MAG TPA: M14 family zinc carboxypeptidase [Saprospiraceae bacterium]|nr:M14 family zinc carboxypeptidase [Saprospiraceae bacterium]
MKLLSALFLCFISLMANAQTIEKYSRVEIDLRGKDINLLTQLGIETDHGIHVPGQMLVADLAASELELVKNAGFTTKIRIEDLKQDYLAKLANPQAQDRDANCSGNGVTPYPTPANYTYGSMGGYHTLSEMMQVLDDMRAKFPNLITARADASDTITTWEGRKIQFVKISDNPDADEPESEVLYTALHHSREPNGASQLLFFMWYLLENYATDPEIKYLVDNLELYFIPCVNPDGYVYNETNDPQGGGMWRKNLRDNGDGSFGVDLNRNYGHFWGNDNNGSSPNPQSLTYRGPSAFSEPETRTIRDFARAHDFIFAHNYHTFSNLLIYPWAYNNTLADPSLAIFAKLFTRENKYKAGTSIETVGYNVNGSSDDWMFAEKGINSYTPEVGKTGFWPQPSEIDDLNRENLWQNLATALCALRFGEVNDKTEQYLSTLNPEINLELVRYGYQDGPFTVSLSPGSSNVLSIQNNSFNVSPLQFETVALTSQVTLNPSIQLGDEFRLLLTYSNGVYSKTDTLRKFYGGKDVVLFEENSNSIADWTVNGNWATTQSTFVSAPFSITDSPNGPYPPVTYSDIQLSNGGIYIPDGAKSPQLRFWAKWDIEPRYDYVQVRASGNEEKALCGRYTKIGSGIGAQPFGEPLFEDLQPDWVEECMDLSAFVGQNISIRFVFGSDNGDERDGFYFDDLEVVYTDPTLLNTVSIPLNDFRLKQNEPNPANDFTVIRWENAGKIGGNATLRVFNALGELMTEMPVLLHQETQIRLNTGQWPAGVYTCLLQTAAGQSQPVKMSILH